MRLQKKLTFTIGLPHTSPQSAMYAPIECFKRRVTNQACFIAGGCTAVVKLGYWCLNGAVEQDCYPESPVPEEAFEVTITMNADKADAAGKHMVEAIREAAIGFQIDTDWVHFTTQTVIGRHFQIREF